MRPYQSEADLIEIVDLANDCERADQLGYWLTVDQLERSLNAPEFDLKDDLRLWEDKSGQLIGYGRLGIRRMEDCVEGFIRLRVHPSVRGQGWESKILTWAEQRLQQVQADGQFNHSILRVGAFATQGDRITLLQDWGFTAVRYFFEMERSLEEEIPQPQFPEGFVLRTVNSEEDGPAWVEMFNQTFIDHWNHRDLTLERYQYFTKDPDHRADLDLIAVAADGTFAAFCEAGIDPHNNQQNGCQEGEIHGLGTRRGFRKQGLGRAMLLAGMHRLRAAGMETAVLGVDSENPSGALKLYESVGFQKSQTSIAYAREL
ncbi:MAG: GNAT family N-acetyltransferase [Microcoleaceae cyanobacterium]